jgi:cytidylate kinase
MELYPAITISRTLGSGGSFIGYRVAERLGWQYCDRAILRQAAEALGVEVATVENQEEHPARFLEWLAGILPAASPESPYMPPAELPVYGREIFALEKQLMERILEDAPAILVGRGGFVALKDRPATLHVHIQARIEFRIQRLVKIGKASTEFEARSLIQKSDRQRAAFIQEISGKLWKDENNFDLVLDSGDLGFDRCISAILASAHKNDLLKFF